MLRAARADAGAFSRWRSRRACALFPLLGLSFFPRTDAGQFVINLKAPTGTRLGVTESEVAKVEALIREVVSPEDLGMIVSNIGADARTFRRSTPATRRSHTAFVQVSLKEEHKTGSYEYMARVKQRIEAEMPELSAYFSIGRHGGRGAEPGPAGADRRAGGRHEHAGRFATAHAAWPRKIRKIPGVADVFIPQDIDYPALQLDVDRTRAGELGLDQREVVGNVITALTSNQMIAPSYWIDPKNGNDYMLTVQYPENQVRTPERSARDSAARRAQHAADAARRDHAASTRCNCADRGGSLPAAAHHRHLCAAAGRGSGPHRQRRSTRSSRGTKVPERA